MRFQEFMGKSHLMATLAHYQNYIQPLRGEVRTKGLNFNESLVLLAAFFEKPGSVSPQQLAETLYLPKDQISHAIKNLLQHGLIRSENSTNDRRQRLIKLTRKGLNLAPKLIELFDLWESKLEEHLDD